MVALGQGCLQVVRFSPVVITPPWLCLLRYTWGMKNRSVGVRSSGTLSHPTEMNMKLNMFPDSGLQTNQWNVYFHVSEIGINQTADTYCRYRWPHCLRRRSAAACMLGSRVRIPLRGWMFFLCLYVVLSCISRGLCDGLITRPEEAYRVSKCVWLRNLSTGEDKAQVLAVMPGGRGTHTQVVVWYTLVLKEISNNNMAWERWSVLTTLQSEYDCLFSRSESIHAGAGTEDLLFMFCSHPYTVYIK
jgi:hypothetical protein